VPPGPIAIGARVAIGIPLLAAALLAAARWPIAPAAALTLTAMGFALALWRPALALSTALALLPVLALAPWSGWLVLEEVDLLLAGLAAAGLLRGCLPPPPVDDDDGGRTWLPHGRSLLAAGGLYALSWAVAMAVGWLAAGDAPWHPTQGYLEPLNTLRQAKAFGWTLLLLPLLVALHRRSPRAFGESVTSGMLGGLLLCGTAALWERIAFPGLLDFSSDYRTSALFWEMHVGGAALDGYLAMAMPFAVHAVLRATTPARLLVAGTATAIGAYACLTTFSRGVYLAVPVGLGLMLLIAYRRAAGTGPSRAGGEADDAPPSGRMIPLALGAALACAAVLAGGSYMGERFADSARDFEARLAHWQRGIALLDAPGDELLGKGLGRWPASLRAATPPEERTGTHARVVDQHGAHLRLLGPGGAVGPGELQRLGQRVTPQPGPWTLRFALRTETAARLHIELCEKHLLYTGACITRTLHLAPSHDRWRTVVVMLDDPVFGRSVHPAPRPGMLTIALASPGTSVDLGRLELHSPDGRQHLRNTAFDDALDHWFFSSDHLHLPWHAKSLALHLLVEQGLLGVAGFIVLCATALGALVGHARAPPLAAPLAGALLAFLMVGLFDSLLDMPRVAFVFFLLIACALLLRKTAREQPAHHQAVAPP
jgi:hypothetical protein